MQTTNPPPRSTMRLKSYSKKELALAYAPDLTLTSALRRLRQWINDDRPLLEALTQAGYRPQQRVLTIKQVKIIFDFIGEP